MKQLRITSAMLALLALAACGSWTGNDGNNGAAPAPRSSYLPPPAAGVGSGSTVQQQRNSGYYPDAGAPLVPANPDQPQ